jgi:flagellar hook-associated protein 1 FlgK
MYNIGLNSSLLLGTQSLQAQQTAIETTGNNISNINTPGYARQRVNFVTDEQSGQGGEQDMGVTISSVESLRSPLLDSLVQQSLGNQGYADNQASLTSTVQDALGEQFTSAGGSSSSGTVTTGSGPIQDAMSTFFSALQSLASSPTDSSARQVVASDAASLTSAINGAYQRVQATQGQIATDASTLTTQINQLSRQIASLNQQITTTEASSGETANSLRDTRTADIESLSSLVNVTATTQSDGTVTVALADNPSVVLVKGDDSNGAGTTQSLSVSYNANAAVPLTVSGSTTGALGTGVPAGGSLGSDLDVANNVIGATGASGGTGILGQMDGVAAQLISQMNTQNKAGYDANGNAGGVFFTGTGAGNIAVSSAVAGNPALIAAASATNSPLDGTNALAMSQLQNSSGITPAFQTMVANLGQTVSTAASNQTTQDQVTQQLQTQRNSVSGVSIDEEMTNLINFQQAYSASARFITTISNMYSVLTNIPVTN